MRKITVISDKLAVTRIEKGYTLRSLAKVSDVDHSTINKLENHIQKTTTPTTAKKLCDALGVRFEDIFNVEYHQNEKECCECVE